MHFPPKMEVGTLELEKGLKWWIYRVKIWPGKGVLRAAYTRTTFQCECPREAPSLFLALNMLTDTRMGYGALWASVAVWIIMIRILSQFYLSETSWCGWVGLANCAIYSLLFVIYLLHFYNWFRFSCSDCCCCCCFNNTNVGRQLHPQPGRK